MTTYVLIHGAWHGGWCWQRVARLIRATGHEVFTPTLTGLGERAHLLNPAIDLNTHVQDVVGGLEYEGLQGVVLVGHSYGGMVITAVAEQAAERLAQLVYLDAFVPQDGQAMVDLMSPEGRSRLLERTRTEGEEWKVSSFPAQAFGITAADDLQWVSARLGPQPLKTFTQPVKLTSPAARALPRTYIYCMQPPMGPFGPFAERAKAEGWRYRELATGHDAMITKPKELVDLLLELA